MRLLLILQSQTGCAQLGLEMSVLRCSRRGLRVRTAGSRPRLALLDPPHTSGDGYLIQGDRNIDSAETEGPLQSTVTQSVDVAAVDLVAVGVGGTDVSAGARLGALQRTQLHQSGPAQHQQQPIETSAVEKRPVELHPHGDPLVGDQTLGAARHQRELAIGGGEDAAGAGSFGTGQRRFGLQFCAL
jgi:hypothetical protein